MKLHRYPGVAYATPKVGLTVGSRYNEHSCTTMYDESALVHDNVLDIMILDVRNLVPAFVIARFESQVVDTIEI